jgi:predicted RNA-binding Zn-ribbon protein involved in translation (DUF1610 family)
MGKKPRFLCDHCGTEVSQDVKACPKCGRVFDMVRCPACGFIGSDESFAEGCPSCGYSSPSAQAQGAKRREQETPLPFWAFFLCAGIAALALAVLFYTLLR